MQIDVLDDVDSLARARESWEAVYASDPEAQFFLSWTWTWNSVTDSRASWLVLAARPSAEASRHVAFLPIRTKAATKGNGFFNEIALGAFRLSDYKGLICMPAFEDAAIPALAMHVRKLHWTNMVLENMLASDRRIRLFLKPYDCGDFIIKETQTVDEIDNVNNSISPYVDLPTDWDAYLASRLSSNTRQKARRFLKKVDAGEFRVTHADASTVKRDLRILLDFWAAKWGERKGEQLASILKVTSTMLLRSFESGSLFLPVLWKGDRPLGALACLADRSKGSLLFHSAGRDGTFTSPPPGFVLHAYAIRHAIAQGFRTYDFLRGNEPYKYLFGAKERRLRCIVIRTRSGRNLGGTLDRRSLPEAFQGTAALHRAGRLAEAEFGYRQILEADPCHLAALFCLGQLLATRGRHSDAVQTFKALLALNPRSHKAWFRLGRSLRAQGDTDGAVVCCRKAVDLEPECRDALALLSEISTPGDDPSQMRPLLAAGR